MTIYSETEYGERKENGGNGQTKSILPPLFNDSDFRKSANKEIITQKSREYQDANKQNVNRLLMGDVGIRNDSGTNVIFHANEKRLKNLDLMSKKDIVIDGRDAHTPYTQAQSLDGRLVQKNISSITNENIISNLESKNQPKTPIDFQAKLKEFTENKLQNKNPSKDKERGR